MYILVLYYKSKSELKRRIILYKKVFLRRITEMYIF